MTVWGRPRHVVQVQLMVAEQDRRGEWRDVPDGPRLDVPCTVQSAREWSTAEENLRGGIQVLDINRIFAKEWPGDERTVIYFEGFEYETVGTPQHFDQSPRTDHWVVTTRRRGRHG